MATNTTLNIIRGAGNARNVLARVDPLDLSSLPESVLERTRQAFGDGVTPAESVVRMLADVKRDGDAAVRHYARLLDGSDLEDFRIPDAELDAASDQVSGELWQSLELAADRVRSFHQATLPGGWIDPAQGLGELVRPLARVGVYAPGGSAAYPSTVLMTVIPARVAGVREIILTTPRTGSQPLNPAVVAAAKIAGVDAMYQVGGVPAIGALAYGTESIPKVDKICGPGNIFVAYAKKLVQGAVDIDGVFGPTETIILADDGANADFCAADLIAQAEHDPLATAILVTDSEDFVARVEAQLESATRRRASWRRGPASPGAPGEGGHRGLAGGGCGIGRPYRSRTPVPAAAGAVELGRPHPSRWRPLPWRVFSRGHGRLHCGPQPRHAHGRNGALRLGPQRPPLPPHNAGGGIEPRRLPASGPRCCADRQRRGTGGPRGSGSGEAGCSHVGSLTFHPAERFPIEIGRSEEMAEFTEKLQESMLPHIRGLGIYQGVDPVEVMAERAGIPLEKIIRLNGNENPYGASPVVAEALAKYQNFKSLPGPEQRQLREALSGYVASSRNALLRGMAAMS